MNTTKFDPRQFCSRKLWQLVNSGGRDEVSDMELREAIAELASRRHYLEQLRQIGALENKLKGA